MIKVKFPTGDWSVGKNWRQLEDNLRAREYESFDNRKAFRHEMRKRVFLGTAKKIPIGLSNEQFIRALEKAGLFQITEVKHQSSKGSL